MWMSDVCVKKFRQLGSSCPSPFWTVCSKKDKKKKKTTTNRRSWDLCSVAASTVLFMRSDRSRSHHSTSFLSASPPSRPQAWSTASLGVHDASLFALFESSADACHIWSTKYYHSARWTRLGLLCNPGTENVLDKNEVFTRRFICNVILNYRDKSSLN